MEANISHSTSFSVLNQYLFLGVEKIYTSISFAYGEKDFACHVRD